MSRQNFTIIIEPDEDSGYISRCFELPGCYSQGETIDETILSMREAIELTIEDMKAHNEEIPKPRHPLLTNIGIEV